MEFTKENAKEADECLTEILKAFPKSKVANYLGEFNTLALFLTAAIHAAPEAAPKKEG